MTAQPESVQPKSEQHPDLKKNVVEGSMLGAGVVLIVLLTAFVNYFGWKYHHRFDWTKTQIYSLSSQTKSVLKALDKDVQATILSSPQAPFAKEVRELLERYAAVSPRVTVRLVDPVKDRLAAETLLKQYETTAFANGIKVILDAGGDRRIFEELDLAELDYSAAQFGGAPDIKSFKGEEVFTSAIVDLTSGKRAKVLFTTGHGERDPDGFGANGFRAARAQLGENVDVETWNPIGKTAVPDGTDLVVLAGPRTPFLPAEVAPLKAYLDRGGRMLALVDPVPQGTALVDLGLGPLFGPFGIEVGRNVVIDLDRPVLGAGAQALFFADYGNHAIVNPLSEGKLPIYADLAASVSKSAATNGYDVTELLETSAAGWGETDLAAAQVSKGTGDLEGPVSVAVAVSKPNAEAPSPESAGAAAAGKKPPVGMRLVVVGDSDLAADDYLRQEGNRAFVSNALSWLLARESSLGIPPKKPEQVRLSLTQPQLVQVFLLLAALPILCIVAGIVVYSKRRR